MVLTVNEFLEALDANPELLEAARGRILTRELLELPQTVGRMSKTLELLMVSHEHLASSHRQLASSHRELTSGHQRLAAALREFMATTDERFNMADERFVELSRTLADLQAAANVRFDEAKAERDALRKSSDEQFAEARERRDTLTQDVGVLKGWHMEYLFDRSTDYYVFTLGYELVETTSMLDRAKMMRKHGDALDIPKGDRESFALADAVAKVRDEDGQELYLAVEVSFTIHWQDTSRAIRNAEYIRRITGLPARAVVAGRQVIERTQATIDNGEALFIRMLP